MTLKKFFYLESLKKISDGTSPKKTDPGPIPSIEYRSQARAQALHKSSIPSLDDPVFFTT